MDVRSTAGIRHGPDRAEPVAAGFIGDGPAVALEIVVERRVRAVVPDIMVSAVCVTLPDLDPGAGSMMLQILLATMLSSAFFVKSWIRQFRGVLLLRNKKA